MRNLNKDEKNYIFNELFARLGKLGIGSARDIDEKIEALVNKAAFDNETISKTFNFLETIYGKDVVSKNTETYRRYNNDIEISFTFDANPNCILYGHFKFVPDEKTLEEVSKQQKIKDTVSSLQTSGVMRNLNIEKYYILFSTWTAPSSERLNKINELIEIIWKDIEAIVSETMETIK